MKTDTREVHRETVEALIAEIDAMNIWYVDGTRELFAPALAEYSELFEVVVNLPTNPRVIVGCKPGETEENTTVHVVVGYNDDPDNKFSHLEVKYDNVGECRNIDVPRTRENAETLRGIEGTARRIVVSAALGDFIEQLFRAQGPLSEERYPTELLRGWKLEVEHILRKEPQKDATRFDDDYHLHISALLSDEDGGMIVKPAFTGSLLSGVPKWVHQIRWNNVLDDSGLESYSPTVRESVKTAIKDIQSSDMSVRLRSAFARGHHIPFCGDTIIGESVRDRWIAHCR